MAGITSIVNPANATELLLFSITPKGFVHLATKSTSDSKETGSAFGSQSVLSDGPMMKQSSLASLLQGNLATIYGIESRTVNNGTTTETVAEVTLISPVYQPLGLYSEPNYGRIATTLRPDDDTTFSAFLYYRKPSEFNAIYEYPLWDSDPDEKKLTPSHIGNQTYLTTYYDTLSTGARHIIYQGDNNGIHDYNITKDSRARLENVTDAVAWTPLAAAWYANKQQVYLYYCISTQGKYKLRRVIRSNTGEWGQPDFPYKAKDMKEQAQLSVMPASNGCHVFYEGAKGGIQHYLDVWKS